MASSFLQLRLVFLVVVSIVLLAGLPQAGGAECNVKDYGAKGDGRNNDTGAFVEAFRACTGKGGPATVYVPPGSYSIWPLIFEKTECTDLLFNVTGDLLAPTDPADYKWVKNESFLLFKSCQNFTLHGWGVGSVDGRGQEWWKHYEKSERPKLVVLDDSTDVTIRDIHLKDSPMFHIVPDHSENILIESVVISAPSDSPNTDGIDPSGSKHVVIRNSIIGTGDDNVAVKPGCQDVLVENCAFLSGHGCSIGSVNTTGVRDVIMRNISFEGTENGARIKTWQGGSGVVENISYINLLMNNVGLPIKINMFYCPDGGCHNHTKGVTIKDIYFSGIAGTQSSGLAGQLYCSDTVPCTHIEMKDINIKSHDMINPSLSAVSSDNNVFECWRAFGKANNVNPPSCLKPDDKFH